MSDDHFLKRIVPAGLKRAVKDLTGITALQTHAAELERVVERVERSVSEFDEITFRLSRTLDGHTFTRAQRFDAEKQPNISLEEITSPAVAKKIDSNPFSALSREELIQRALQKGRWRYHHNIDELRNAPTLYKTYAQRVDTMLEMLDRALESENLLRRLSELTVADLGCSEGFVAMRYLERGLKEADCYELNIGQIEQLHLVQALKKIEGMNVYRLDLENVAWGPALHKAYDLVFCLGIVYHMENPMLFLRNLYSITKRICLVESDTPQNSLGFGCLVQQDCQVTLMKGQVRYILEQRPNRRALVDMLLNAGFSSVSVIEPPSEADSKSIWSGRKSVLIARKE